VVDEYGTTGGGDTYTGNIAMWVRGGRAYTPTAGIVVDRNALELQENAEGELIWVALTTAPTSDVVLDVMLGQRRNSDVAIDLTPDRANDIAIDIERMVFTANNWNQPQTLTITALDDLDINAAIYSGITMVVDGGAFAGVRSGVLAFVTDDEADGVFAQAPAIKLARPKNPVLEGDVGEPMVTFTAGREGDYLGARSVVEYRVVGTGAMKASVLSDDAVDNNLKGFAGADTFVGEVGADIFRGGIRLDRVRYDLETGAGRVVVDLAAGTATDTHGDSDTLKEIEVVVGSGDNDILRGDDSANRLFREKGSDVIIENNNGLTIRLLDVSIDDLGSGDFVF